MPQIAKIYILDIPYHVDIAYSYYIPQSLEDSITVGGIVEVPFGKGNRKMTGIVVDITDEECGEKIKPVSSVIGEGPILSGELIGLCRFVKDYTLCTFGDAVRAVVPSAALSKVITYYRIIPENERTSVVGFKAALDAVGERGRIVYSAASKKQKFTRQYLQTELEFDCTGIIAQMLKYGLCERCTEIKNSSSPKVRRMLSLSQKLQSEIGYEPSYFDEVLMRLRGSNQKKILEGVKEAGRIADFALFDDLGIKHTAGKNAVDSLENYGLVSVSEEEAYRNHFTLENAESDEPFCAPVLSEEQTAARDKIVSLYESHTPCAALLHGVTGSGKTNVIMASIDRVLEDGRGVIMLVPEIALTPQTVGIFLKRYGDNIAVIHSGLSGGERYDAWRRIKTGQANVVIGTRSAIFAPLHDIGMIIIDEEHEYTYKSDTNPKYHAHDIARYRCRDHNAVMLLSSATPSVSSYYKAKTGSYTLIELKERYGNATLPTVQIYDMRGETQRGNLSPIGSLLADRLHSDSESGNQSI
ncbi:MAG: primosomal protein N', partial [Ruminococcaceae bacterium]|nr:primosomal protein N' [Oscillospiraceae bacterium]